MAKGSSRRLWKWPGASVNSPPASWATSTQTPQQTLTEVAARSKLSRAGARRILLTLQTLGYVQSDGKLFRLTARILDLGFAYLSSMPIWNLAEPVMEELVADR